MDHLMEIYGMHDWIFLEIHAWNDWLGSLGEGLWYWRKCEIDRDTRDLQLRQMRLFASLVPPGLRCPCKGNPWPRIKHWNCCPKSLPAEEPRWDYKEESCINYTKNDGEGHDSDIKPSPYQLNI